MESVSLIKKIKTEPNCVLSLCEKSDSCMNFCINVIFEPNSWFTLIPKKEKEKEKNKSNLYKAIASNNFHLYALVNELIRVGIFDQNAPTLDQFKIVVQAKINGELNNFLWILTSVDSKSLKKKFKSQELIELLEDYYEKGWLSKECINYVRSLSNKVKSNVKRLIKRLAKYEKKNSSYHIAGLDDGFGRKYLKFFIPYSTEKGNLINKQFRNELLPFNKRIKKFSKMLRKNVENFSIETLILKKMEFLDVWKKTGKEILHEYYENIIHKNLDVENIGCELECVILK